MNSIFGVDQDSFLSSLDCVYGITDKDKMNVSKQRDDFNSVYHCILFLDKLSSRAEEFTLLGKHKRLTPFGKELLKNIKRLTIASIKNNVFLYNPKVHLLANFIEHYDMLNELESLKCIPAREPVLLEYLYELKRNLNSRDMHAQVKNFQRGPAKNYNGLVRYTNILTARYARLLVIRIDLSFLELYREGVSLEEFFEYREKLLGDRRYRPFLKDIVGHAWSLEYAKKTGYHYHMLFFYDGSKHREDITIGMGIGEQWKKITGGKGRYYLCNHKKGSYRFCGIGVVDYHDRIACENLNKAIAYLTKPQLFAKVTGFLEARVRSFGRGVLPKMSPRKGRPRRKGIHLIS